MNARHNALGQGNRANATIGRALRLVAMNVLGSKPGESDASSFGHPGQVHVLLRRGPAAGAVGAAARRARLRREDTTVTVRPGRGPAPARPAADGLGGGRAALLRGLDPPPDVVLDRQGRPRRARARPGARRLLHRRRAGRGGACASTSASRPGSTPDELVAAGVQLEQGAQHDMSAGADGKLATLRSPDDVLLVTAGGEGAGWSAWLPAWAPTIHAYRATRRVRPAGEPLPDCGPDGCIVPWMRLNGRDRRPAPRRQPRPPWPRSSSRRAPRCPSAPWSASSPTASRWPRSCSTCWSTS